MGRMGIEHAYKLTAQFYNCVSSLNKIVAFCLQSVNVTHIHWNWEVVDFYLKH